MPTKADLRLIEKILTSRNSEIDCSIVSNIQRTFDLNSFEGLVFYDAYFLYEANLILLLKDCLRKKINCYFPKYSEIKKEYGIACVNSLDDLKENKFNIKEPVSSIIYFNDEYKTQNYLWFVPGLLFDFEFNRLGRGFGFYDRLLKGACGLKVGITINANIYEHKLPFEETDVKMDYLVSDLKVYTKT